MNNRSVSWNFDGIYRLNNETITGALGNENGTASYGLIPSVTDRQQLHRFPASVQLAEASTRITTTRLAETTAHLTETLRLQAIAAGYLKANLVSDRNDSIGFELVSANPNQPTVVRIEKRNTGLLDAIHVKSFAFVTTDDGSRNIDEVCSSFEQRLHDLVQANTSEEATVPAGQLYSFNAQGPVLSPEDALKIRDGRLGVYVVGTFSYSDMMHHARSTWLYRKRVKGNLPDCAGRRWNLNWQ